MLSSLTDVQFIPCNCKGTTMWRPLQGATMCRPFSSISRTLSLFSLQSSSSSTPPSPFIVRSSDLSSSSSVYPSNVDVTVWWDFDTCELPTGVSVSQVLPIITAALKVNGINAPIEMYAFGNINNLSIENQEAILSSGIDFKHIDPKVRDPDPLYNPGEWQNGVYRAIVTHHNFWRRRNSPLRHLFFISGYGDLAPHLYSLVQKNYHVVVASTGPDKDWFCRVANMAFDWNSLIRGENLIGHRPEFWQSRRFDFTKLCWVRPFKDNVIPEVEDGFSSSKEPTSLNIEE